MRKEPTPGGLTLLCLSRSFKTISMSEMRFTSQEVLPTCAPAACTILFRGRERGGRRPGDADRLSFCYYNKTPPNKMAQVLRRLEVRGQDGGMAGLWRETFRIVSSCGKNRPRELSGLSLSGCESHLRDSFSQPDHIFKDLSPNSIPMGVHF